jgi:alkylation response protein AidB-like acyl-CoA dehydrogenase
MDMSWPTELEALRKEAEDVAADAVARFGRYDDAWINGYAREFSRELGARGWIGMTWPTEYGGGGRTALERFVVTEALIDAGAPIAASWFADRQMGPTILAYGTEEQKQAYLPGILAGDTGWCIGMSEPDAGSDLAGLRTAAMREGDDYVVNGQKIWTSFGATADYCYLICRTSTPPECKRHLGISELIVPMDTPGITVKPIHDMHGGHHFCEVYFDDVRVPAANLVGVEGESFKQTMRQLEHERGGIDRLLSNHARYGDALERADRSDPIVRQDIARLETGYRIGRMLVLRETLKQAPAGFSAATKTFCTEHEQRVAEFVARAHGAEALLWDGAARAAGSGEAARAAGSGEAARAPGSGAVGQAYCYAPAYTIMGGTANILRNVLAERLLGLPRSP